MYINDVAIETEKCVIDVFAGDATLTKRGISLVSITVGFLLLQCFSGLLDTPGISRCRSQHVSVESSSCFIIVFICDLFVSRDNPLMS